MRKSRSQAHRDRAARRRLSCVNELSFLPTNRPRPVPPATQLSSANGLSAVDSHILAAWERAGAVDRTPGRAIFIVTSGHLAVRETAKTDTVAVAGCQRRFLFAGQKHGWGNLRCHGTPIAVARTRLDETASGPCLAQSGLFAGQRVGHGPDLMRRDNCRWEHCREARHECCPATRKSARCQQTRPVRSFLPLELARADG
jgi:hypothetical protein